MAAGKSEYSGTEIKAGILVLAALAVFAVFAAAVLHWRPPKEVHVYHAHFSDTLGLNPGAAVRFGGARAGRVKGIGLNPGNQTELRVDFEVEPGIPVNEGSRAFISQATLTSEKHVEITTGEEGASLLDSGSEIPSEQRDLIGVVSDVGAKVSEALDGVNAMLGTELYASARQAAEDPNRKAVTPMPELLGNVDGAVSDLREAFQANRGNVDEIVAGLRQSQQAVQDLMAKLNAVVDENRPDIRGGVESARRTLAQAEETAAEVRGVIADIKTVSGELDTLADSLDQTLSHSAQAADHARGILEANRPMLEDLVRDLRAASENAREFTRILSEEPQAVLRGHEPQGRIGE